MALTKITAPLAPSLLEKGKVIPSSDYNLAVDPGFYQGIGAPVGTNSPPDLARYGTLLVTRTNVYVTQIASFGHSGGIDLDFYVRSSNNTGATWTSWRPVSPEYGTNANGHYSKFADGTMICSRAWTAGLAVASGYAEGFYGVVAWTFPANFVTTHFASLVARTANHITPTALADTVLATSSVNFFVHDIDTAHTETYQFGAYAVGRWF